VSDWLTLLKVVGIALFVIVALALGKGTIAGLTGVTPVFDTVRAEGALAPAIATSLVFVMFCYSGWNAAAYMAGEMKTPERDLPRSLLYGTGLVVLLYLGLNATYLYAVGLEGIEGEVEVGLIAARGLFGGLGVTLVASVISVSILASASAMTIAGPRVYYAFGRDYGPMRWLAALGGRGGAPHAALVLQGVVTSFLIVSGRVDQIQQYAGFTLTLFTSLAVSCVLVLRFRRPGLERPFRAWGYPVTPLLFLGASVWMMVWAFRGRPVESSLSLLTVAIGGLIFLVFVRRAPRVGQ
jgi:APA family basic amino acid/polyamine antiporter